MTRIRKICRMFFLVLTSIILLFNLSPCGLAIDNVYEDISQDDWYYTDVLYAYQYGLMNGIGNGKFGPELSVTRGMFVTILYRMEGEPSASGVIQYTDVDKNAYYENPISWATEYGIVDGVGSNRFAPDEPLTREQFATVIYRYAAKKGHDVSKRSVTLESYSDFNQISSYAREALSWANAEGLISGVSANIIKPSGMATRSQTAAILHRYAEKTGAFVPAPEADAIQEQQKPIAAQNQQPEKPTVPLTEMPKVEAQKGTDPKHTVTFYSDPQMSMVYLTETIKDGERAYVPNKPKDTAGKTFEGWSLSSETGQLFDFGSPIKNDISLVARWGTGSAITPAAIQVNEQTTPQPTGIKTSDLHDLSESNIFKVETSMLTDNEATVTVSLCGNVQLCGFDLNMYYDKDLFMLSSCDTERDLQIVSSADSARGVIEFNYSAAQNVTTQKEILTATFIPIGSSGAQGLFSLNAEEVISSDSADNYLIKNAPYTLTYDVLSIP